MWRRSIRLAHCDQRLQAFSTTQLVFKLQDYQDKDLARGQICAAKDRVTVAEKYHHYLQSLDNDFKGKCES
jgi:hypothetical protein